MTKKTVKADMPQRKPRPERRSQPVEDARELGRDRNKADQFEHMDGAECTWFKKA